MLQTSGGSGEPTAESVVGQRPAARIVTVAAIAAVLLLPAIANGFPLVFPDTSAYLSVDYADSWPIDRAGFYGFILSPALLSLPDTAGVWLAAAFQAALIAIVLLAAVRRLIPDARPLLALALIALAAVFTSLSWHASQLLPDAFTGALVLLVWLAASRDLARPGTALLWFAAGVLALVHFTHVGLLLAGSAATLIVCAFNGLPAKELARRAVAAVLTVCAVLAAHTAVYGIYFDRWTPSPLGGYFLFARLNEDGLVPRWFDRHCGKDAPKPLCDLRPSIPHDSQQLLWGKGPSPLYDRINRKQGSPEKWPWVDMVSEAATGAIREEPGAFLANAARATGEQLVHFQALDDECPDNCRNLRLFEWRPGLIEPVRSSRQLTGGLPREQIRVVTGITATAGLLLLLPFFALAVRRRDAAAQALLATIATCLVANAAMAGALSDVHDRYQSRVVWLAPFAVLLVAARWRAAVGTSRP